MYNLKGFIKDIEILRKTRMRKKTRKLFERITHQLIKVLRDTTHVNEEELIALTETIKRA